MNYFASPVTNTRWLTLPNVLTIFRLLLIPIFIHQMAQRRMREAFLVFLAAGLTDLLDGFVARTWNVRTPLGRILDPVADKLLLVSSFIAISLPQISQPIRVPVWLLASVISRDSLIAIGALLLFAWKGIRNFAPSLWGKICTFFQVLTVLFVLAGNVVVQEGLTRPTFFQGLSSPRLHNVIFITAFVLTVISGIHYSVFGIKKVFFSN